jgi:RNA polymerase sigma-70 factor (ECF subfamily)
MSDGSPIRTAEASRVDFGHQWLESYPVLIGRARRLSAGGAHDPEDLLSQATLKVLNYLSLEREVENFLGLMLVSLLQVYQDSNRRNGNRIFRRSDELFDNGHPLEISSAVPCVERTYIAKESLGDIFDYLSTMPRAMQQMFRMRFVQDLSYTEISQQMGISETAARRKICVLRKRLREWFQE